MKQQFNFIKTVLLLVTFALMLPVQAQETIFTESMGTVSATTAIATHEANNGFDNDQYTMTDGGAANAGDIRATSASTGYSGASGLANVWLTSTAGDRGFAIEGIDASLYTSLKVQFGYRKESASALPALALDYWDGTQYVNVPFTFDQAANAATGWYLSPEISLPAGAQITDLKLRWVKSGSIAVRLDDVKLTGVLDVGTPSLTVNPATLSGFEYYFGQGPSSSQSFTVSGINLTDDVTITAPVNYEISDSDTGPYSGSLDFIPVSGEVSEVVYVRLKSLLAVGDYNNEDIDVESLGAVSKTVTCSGSVLTADPLITLSASTLSGFTYVETFGPSAEQQFTVEGIFLTDDITITPPTNYEISTGTGGSFVAQSSIVLTQSGGDVAQTTIYVRLKAGLALGTYNNEVITASSTGAANKTVTCNGSVIEPPPTATVLLRPAYIDLSSTTAESAVLMQLENYPSDDARYRLYNGGNQYNCWNAATETYVTSNQYSNGPAVPGTPSGSTIFWILSQRGSNNSTAGFYRDRLGPGYTTNYQTTALPAATEISSPFSLSGKFVGTGTYDNSEKYVVLAYDGTTLVSAASTTLTTGTFSVVCPDGTTIDKIEVRAVDNTLIEELTGTWNMTTDVGPFPCPENLTEFNDTIWDYELPYAWEGNLYWAEGEYQVVYQTANGCDSTLQLNLTVDASGTLWVNKQMGTAAQANWSPIAGVDRYQVRYWDTQGGGIFVTVVQTTNQFRKLTDLVPNTDYEIEIGYRACTNCPFVWGYYPNVQFNSGEVDFWLTQDIGTKAVVNWTELDDVSGYILQYRTGGGNWIMKGLLTSTSETMYFTEGTEYEFRVIPRYDNIGFWPSAAKAIETNYISFVIDYNGGETAAFTWDDVVNPAATSYILQIRETGTTSWQNYTTSTNARFVNDLLTGLTYEYRLVVRYGAASWGATSIRPMLSGTKEAAINMIQTMSVYPNPVSDLLTVEVLSEQTGKHIWNLYDVSGKLMMSGENQLTQGSNYFVIETAHLSAGLYLLQSNVNGVLQTSRIMKQ